MDNNQSSLNSRNWRFSNLKTICWSDDNIINDKIMFDITNNMVLEKGKLKINIYALHLQNKDGLLNLNNIDFNKDEILWLNELLNYSGRTNDFDYISVFNNLLLDCSTHLLDNTDVYTTPDNRIETKSDTYYLTDIEFKYTIRAWVSYNKDSDCIVGK